LFRSGSPSSTSNASRRRVPSKGTNAFHFIFLIPPSHCVLLREHWPTICCRKSSAPRSLLFAWCQCMCHSLTLMARISNRCCASRYYASSYSRSTALAIATTSLTVRCLHTFQAYERRILAGAPSHPTNFSMAFCGSSPCQMTANPSSRKRSSGYGIPALLIMIDASR